MPAISKKCDTTEPAGSQVPDFKPDALRSLTERIESNLINRGKGAISKNAAPRSKANTPNAKKKRGEYAVKAPVSMSTVQATSKGSTPIGNQKPTKALKMSQGKKRLRDGRIKGESDGKNRDNVNAVKLGTRNRKAGLDTVNKLEDEMKALGGTKEDVDLIADIASESDMEGGEPESSKNLGNGLEKEIEQLVRQLGVDRVAKNELMADSEPEEVEEPVENWNSDMTYSNTEMISGKPALETTASIGKGQRSLVSKQQFPFWSFRWPC